MAVKASNWVRIAAAMALTSGLAAGPASAKIVGGVHTAQSSASETGAGENPVQRTINSTYNFDLLWEPDGIEMINVLFEQTVESEQYPDADAPSSELKVTAYKRGPKGYTERLWTIRDTSNEGSREGDYYRTTLYGCCGGENLYRHYQAWTGKLAFIATADPVIAGIPNTPVRRTFGYLSANAAAGFDLEKWPTGAGLITLVDGATTQDQLLLEAEGEGSNYQWTPTVTLVDPARDGGQNGDTLDLWGSDNNPDPLGITGFNLVLTWDSQTGEVATIPVVAGRFDLKHAVLPEGLTVRRPAD